MKLITKKFAQYGISYYLCNVKIRDMINRLITENEWELIQMIRNFRNGRHNPSIELEMEVDEMFEQLKYEP